MTLFLQEILENQKNLTDRDFRRNFSEISQKSLDILGLRRRFVKKKHNILNGHFSVKLGRHLYELTG